MPKVVCRPYSQHKGLLSVKQDEARVLQGQGRAGQGRAGQGRAGQGRAGQGRAGQGRAGQSALNHCVHLLRHLDS